MATGARSRPNLRLLALVISPFAFAVSSCGSDYDGRPPHFEYIAAVILAPNCATVSCHSPAAALSGLDFSDPDRAYTSLTRLRFQIVDRYAMGEMCAPENETVVCRGGFRPLIMPFNPAQSRLVHLLRDRTPPRMPPDRPLFEADIRLIEDWILLGAPRRAGGPPAQGAPRTDGGAGGAGGARDAAPILQSGTTTRG